MHFSTRETQIMALLSQRLSNKEIAQALSISERTVKFHVSNMLRKTQTADRYALMYGLTADDLKSQNYVGLKIVNLEKELDRYKRQRMILDALIARIEQLLETSKESEIIAPGKVACGKEVELVQHMVEPHKSPCLGDRCTGGL